MQTVIDLTVKLQDPYQYMLLPLLLATLILVSPVIIHLFKYILSKRRVKPVDEEPAEVVKTPVVRRALNVIKADYIKRINVIEAAYNNKEIDSREMHQRLSSTVREFVNEVTGISAQTFVLSDFAKVQMPQVQALIEAFYAPEFAPQEIIELQSAENARKVVSEWN